MKADYIEIILDNAEKLPYRCILFDGPWGIGKTYTVNKSLEKYEHVCKVSMFGIQNSHQIYHEVLFQTALKKNIGGKIADSFLKVINSIAKVWNKSDIAKDIISSITNERDIFLQMARQFKVLHIIVIDDLERISDKVIFEGVLGVIEELKQCNFVKVILIANIEELPNENRSLFDKYNEKVIDRIYHIAEMPYKVNWEDLGIDNEFLIQFLSKHAVKNFRTLQKAQNFYDDVKLYCAGINEEKFLNEIKLICFAIVVESTDNLYLINLDENEETNGSEDEEYIEKITTQFNNLINHRVYRYLTNIDISWSLIDSILEYYNNETNKLSKIISEEYVLYVSA